MAQAAPPLHTVKESYERHKGVIWLTLALLPALTVAAGLLVAPDVFHDHYVWRDLYGPILTDAKEWPASCLAPNGEIYRSTQVPYEKSGKWWSFMEPSKTGACERGGVGAVEGYTPISEATYAYVLGLSLYGIFTGIFRRHNVRTGGAFVGALTPYILLGPFWRVLEDAQAFHRYDGSGAGALAPLFISPVIYMHIAVYTVLFLSLGVFLQNRRDTAPRRVLTGILGLALLAEVAGYWLVGTRWASEFNALAPLWVVALAALAGLALVDRRVRERALTVNTVLFAGGLPLIVPAAYLVGVWLSGNAWMEDWTGHVFLSAGAVILGLAIGATTLVALLAYLGRKKIPRHRDLFSAYLAGVALAIVFGHMLDGFATYVALFDPFNMGPPLGSYGEKHPVSEVLLGIGGGLGFPAAKLLLVLGAIYLLDKESRQGGADDRRLVGLIMMAIFVLGFAPGTRDLLRVTMGV